MFISSNIARKLPYESLQIPNISFVSPAYSYQYQKTDESEDEFRKRLIDEIEADFLRLGPEKVVSFIAEPVVGATAGCVAAPKGYFSTIRKLCDGANGHLLCF